MKKIHFMIVALLMSIPALSIAQKTKVLSGNFNFLKGQSEINVVFDYDGMTLYNENMSEQQYIEKRIKEISENKDKAEAENWRKDWEYSKTNTFVEKFLASWNKNNDIKAGHNIQAPYTLIVKTTWIYPGWFAGVMNQHAKVSTRLIFVDTKNKSNKLLEIESIKAPGNIAFAGVPNNNDRIAEGYAKTSKTLAGMVSKKAK